MTPGEGAVPVVVSDDHHHHDPPFELNAGQRIAPVYERPERIDALLAAIDAAARRPARAHGEAPITAVHDPDMVAFLRDGYDAWRAAGGPAVMIPDTFASPRWAGGGRPSASPFGQAGWWCFDTATPVVAGSYRAARAAVDVALTATELVVDGAPLAYGVTRPPGHHAGRDYFGGFCLFNHAAIAARHLASDGRVSILDIDVHHGNGTQDLFWRDAGVQYVSLHADPDTTFPFFSGFAEEVGEGPGRHTTVNLPLPPGTGDEAYLHALDAALDRVTDFAPAAVVVSLGFDTASSDPIGPLALTATGFRAIGERIATLGAPAVLLQEGGYAVEHLGGLAAALLAGLRSASTSRAAQASREDASR